MTNLIISKTEVPDLEPTNLLDEAMADFTLFKLQTLPYGYAWQWARWIRQ